LAPALAEAFLQKQKASDIRRVPRAEEVEMEVEGTLPGEDSVSVIEIEAHGSGTSFTALKEGRADIGMASRRINDDETKTLRSLGDMTSRANEHVLGLDGVAVIVNESNPIGALDIDKIRRIFTGAIGDWKDVGGSPGAIHLYARDNNSGTFDTFKNLVLHGEEISRRAKRFQDSRELSIEVARDVSGIGFIGMPFIGSAKALKVFEGSSVPMHPTRMTVGTEDYRLSRRLYLYTASTPENPWVKKFVEFALSDEGQKVVDAIGFIGQSLKGEQDRSPTEPISSKAQVDVPSHYYDLTKDAERLPFNVHFTSGSSKLDNKAYRDLGRLLQLMEDSHGQSIGVVLLGFTDDVGDPQKNLDLSRQRAETVKDELIAVGISPRVVEGFGKSKPVASNSTAEGRSRNRRVEVWLRR
jgi:phosphate transport system substrate-binding protein